MKKLLLIVAVLLVAATPPLAGLMAKEIELAPVLVEGVGVPGHFYNMAPSPKFPTEQELSWDDGTDAGFYFPGSYSPYATTFTAPADCHLVRYRFYWYGGGSVNVDCLLYADDGGGTPHTPTGSTLFTVAGNSGSTSFDWFEVDVSAEGVTLSNGDIFHPGWSHTSTTAGVLLDDFVSGSYACWLWLGMWYDYSPYNTHMMRVVVNDDADGPYGDQYNPGDGDTAAPDTNIVWHCYDDDIGVDSDTINTDSMLVEVAKSKVSGTITITGDPSDYEVTFDPDSDFTEGDTVNVTLSPPDYAILDLLTNSMDEVTYSFTIGPYVTIQSTSLGYIKAIYE